MHMQKQFGLQDIKDDFDYWNIIKDFRVGQPILLQHKVRKIYVVRNTSLAAQGALPRHP